MSGSRPRSEGEDDRPGAAFGIPKGATGEDVVDAVMGAGAAGSGGPGGIDPGLLPYLEAADGGPDEAGGTGSTPTSAPPRPRAGPPRRRTWRPCASSWPPA